MIANQPGNSNYAAATQVTQTVNAILASQTITFTTNAPASTSYNSNFTVAATASSGLAVAFTSSGSCGNSGATYTMTSGTGTCSVIANQAGNNNYAATQETETANATSAPQAITFTTNAPSTAAYNSSFTVAANVTSGLKVVFASSGSCTNSGATYTMTSGTGACSVIANQPGNSNYAAAPQVTQTVNATLAPQTITFTTNAPASAAYNSTFTVATTGGGSGNPVSYTSAGSCSNAGATYTMTNGTSACSVITNQPGNSNYAAAPQVTQTVNATLGTQTITFTTNAPASAAYGGNFTVAANATSGLAVVFTSAGSCSNTGATYTMTSGTGMCSVVANQPGNGNYAPAPQVTQAVSATPGTQTITFTTNAPASAAYGSSFTVAAGGGGSGNPVVFASAGSCTNSGATYIVTSGTGTCSVIANQPGNSNYAPAPAVMQTVNAAPGTQTITFTTNAPASAVNGSAFTVAATASSGLAVAYTSAGSCSNSGATYTMTSGTGTCSVIANQAGNGNYSAAPQVTQSVTATEILPYAATPAASVTGGTYNSTQTVSLTDSTAGASIYYTTNGDTPTTSSTLYTGPISVSQTETIEAIAIAAGCSSSAVFSATYMIDIPPDFSLGVNPASITISAAQPGTVTVSVTPQNGLSSAVSFSCEGLPSGATCSFLPQTVTPSSGVATTTLTVSTSAPANLARLNLARLNVGVLSSTALSMMLCCWVGYTKRRRARALMALGVFTLMLMAGCGGGSTGSTTTPPSTSNVTLTATAGTLQHTVTFALTVQ
ncbi:MAG: chitobiase/beta-hexosaminidase C-terminal domain-containing protein [Terriglobales bacterium]